MGEYINRKALRKVLENWRDAHADVDDEQGCGLLEDVIWEIDAQPAADVATVVHGRWERDADGDWYCTNCDEVVAICESGRERTYRKPYCPNCGAKMDGGTDDAADGNV